MNIRLVYFSAAVLFLSAFSSGCARRQEISPALSGESPDARADVIVAEVFSAFLPSVWPPRRIIPAEEELPAEAIQPLEVSSLAYLPRLLPRLRERLSAAGFGMAEEESGLSSLTLVLSPEAVLRYDIIQSVSGRLALVIDDVGRVPGDGVVFGGLDYPLTLAILPRLPHSAEWDALAQGLGYEVLLHCPLSALDPELDLGPGGIAEDLSPEEIAAVLRADLASVPHAIGANNHMGSAFTLQTEAMRALLGELNSRGLFFLDSLTSPHTVTRTVATEIGIPFVARDVFLDHENTEEFILAQIAAARKRALKNGRAIAIGHFRPLTLEVLKREIPSLARDGIQIVPLSDLAPETRLIDMP